MKLTDTPTAPEFLAESEEEQAFLRSLADEFIEQMENTEKAMAAKFDAQMFDLDEGNAFWALLPAKVRTAIRRGKEVPGVVCAECNVRGAHMRNCSIGGKFA